MKANEHVTPEQMTVICNIQAMQGAIGIKGHNFEWLSNQSYEWLYNHQNSMIQHYNEAISNKK